MTAASPALMADTLAPERERARSPRRPRARRIAAIAVLATGWLLSLVTLVLSAVFGLSLLDTDTFVSFFLLNAVIYAPVSALLIARRSYSVGIVLAVLAIGSGVSAVGAQYSLLALEHPGLPAAGLAQHILDRAWMPGTLASFCVVPLMISSRRPGMRSRFLVIAGLAASALAFLVTIVRQRPGAAPNPLAIADEPVQDALLWLFYLSLTVVVAIAVVSGVVLVWRWRYGPPDERRGLGWLTIGQWLLIVLFSPTLVVWFPGPAQLLIDYAPLALPIAQLLMPAAILVAALGRRMWGIDIALNRAVMWVLLVVSLLLCYIVLAFVFSVLLPVPPTSAGVVAVAVLALSIEPLRLWLQRRVDALVYGEAADPASLMRSLGSRLSDTESADGLRSLVHALRSTLRLGWLEVRSVDPDGSSASSGFLDVAGPRHTFELRDADEVIGIVVAAAEGDQRIDRRTAAVLETISGVLAVALQLSDVNRESEEARERVREVDEEERRMVRRELRDGLAPALAAHSRDLEAVGPIAAADPAVARRRLAELRAQLSERTNEVRDLARTLLPGALDNGDLDAALAELAARFKTLDLDITVHSTGTDELDATRQAGIYHIVAEAVLLVRRTAGVTRLEVTVLLQDPRSVVIRIDDDGAGLRPGADAVLASIRDRAEELGGTLEVTDRRGLHLCVQVPA